ncbi:MAG: HlyD family efflux transporter periplasmic adaptor subunit [Mariprofundales bacterium]
MPKIMRIFSSTSCFFLVLLLLLANTANAVAIQGSARIQAAEQATLSAQLPGNISRLYVDEGESFAKGARLFASDCREPAVQLKASRVELASLNRLLSSAQKLLAAGAADRSTVEEYQARTSRLRGQVDYLKYQTGICLVRAPYAGKVAKHLLHAHDWAQQGQGVMDIISSTALEAKIIVSVSALTVINPGDAVLLRINGIGQSLRAKITGFDVVADPNSQTIGLKAILLDTHPLLRPGMIGEAVFGN